MAKIFINYKWGVTPDTPDATARFEALRHDHDVYMDTTIQVGEKWAKRIQNAIKDSGYLIIFFSKNLVHSEMVIAEDDVMAQAITSEKTSNTKNDYRHI